MDMGTTSSHCQKGRDANRMQIDISSCQIYWVLCGHKFLILLGKYQGMRCWIV